MKRNARLALFLCGTGVFAYLVGHVGASALEADAAHTGWMFVPILALGGLVYLCYAGASWLILTRERSAPPFWRTFAITTSAFSLNYITPMVNLGGEPFKIAAVSAWLGTRRATGFALLYQMLHTLAILLTSLTAVGLALVFLPHEPAIISVLLLAALGLVVAIWLVFAGHRHGVLERALNLLHRAPLCRRLARRIEPMRAGLVEMDEQITRFYHADRQRFFRALALEYLGRFLIMLEYYLILLSLGHEIGLLEAFMIGALSALVDNLLFLLPFELGSKEGSLYVLFGLIGLAPALGVYAALVSRIRDLVWIGVGLVLIWGSGRRPATQAA